MTESERETCCSPQSMTTAKEFPISYKWQMYCTAQRVGQHVGLFKSVMFCWSGLQVNCKKIYIVSDKKKKKVNQKMSFSKLTDPYSGPLLYLICCAFKCVCEVIPFISMCLVGYSAAKQFTHTTHCTSDRSGLAVRQGEQGKWSQRDRSRLDVG